MTRTARALAALAALSFATPGAAGPPLARVTSAQGTVEAQRAGAATWTPVKVNDLLSEGDQVRVLARSRADLLLLDRSVLRLNENSALTIEPPRPATRTGVVALLRGAVHVFSRGRESLTVNTPFTVAGVRGTEFLVEVEPDRTLLTTFEGAIVASSEAGSLTVNGGESAVAERGKAPVLRTVARPRDAVQWALYYPPVVYFRPGEFADGPGWQGDVRRSLEAYGRGELGRSLDALVEVPAADVGEGRFFAWRAHLLLAVGRVDEARADVDRALALSAADPDALALRTITAVAQNDGEGALRTARAAVAAAPRSAAAQLALSYALQARFDLDGARAAVAAATVLDPANALAWARLAELEASSGDLARSRAAADRAVALDPGLARTQTVLGFASLSRTEIPTAVAAFERAIALDSADPLPRLGLGLARIRTGDLSAGARDLETAASLDPGNPLVRSYLGKAYHEEKRTGLDEREYDVARQVDPNDPTPWFYGAIAKQTTNRPVEALQDLERAKALNDHRAVYRSRLLLDSDLAARSASLGRIYADLGFQQLALVEGWTAVDADPTSFSAHRLLADSYAALPRHEMARVSELLQSQLLQPLNVTPIQPTLAESNLFLVGASGAATLAFNEFNPIFNRDRIVAQPAAVGGSRGLYAGEAVLAAIQGSASVSAGYSRFATDGFRRNADQQEDLANAFVQYELSESTSVQGEYRYRQSLRGDLPQRFWTEDYFPGQRNREEHNVFRVGGRHAFSPGSILLVSASLVRASATMSDAQFPDPVVVGPMVARSPLKRSTGAELQHLLRVGPVSLRTGAGYFDTREPVSVSQTLLLPVETSPGVVELVQVDGSFSGRANVRHANGYVYADVHPFTRLSLTAGISVDALRGDLPADRRSFNQWNPKLGAIWRPLPGTTLRAGAFRTVKRTLTTQQTLEPTEVAGLNQLYDDADLSRAWRFGAAVDQKLLSTLFGGVELARRNVTWAYVDGATGAGVETRWREIVGRGYLFWTPHRFVAARADYLLERVADVDPALGLGATRVETQRVPLGLGFFHPSGAGATVGTTWVRQTGDFGGFTSTSPLRHGGDEFWLVDAGASYRLPRRYGLLAIGATNLLDRRFRYFDTDLRNASLQPVRTVYGRVTLAFP